MAAEHVREGADDLAHRRLRRHRVDAADPDVNLMPGLIDAVSTQATVGEIVGALADVFGRYREDPVI